MFRIMFLKGTMKEGDKWVISTGVVSPYGPCSFPVKVDKVINIKRLKLVWFVKRFPHEDEII